MNLNQITAPCTDLERSVAFYQSLGLKLIVHAPPRYARFECLPGGNSFSLHKVDALGSGPGIYVYFEREDLDAYCALLREKGINFDQDPKDESWLWREARLKDPDGNQLIIYHAGENRLNPPWRL